jgi:putative transposase
MARPLRIEFPGAVYHITARGNRRAPIFRNEKDKSMFLDIVGWVHDRFRWICYSYCLMENHYHFAVETPEGNLSTGMRHLNGVYTQRYREGCQRSAHRAHVAYGYSLKETGDFLGVHYSTVSKWVEKVEGDKS